MWCYQLEDVALLLSLRIIAFFQIQRPASLSIVIKHGFIWRPQFMKCRQNDTHVNASHTLLYLAYQTILQREATADY